MKKPVAFLLCMVLLTSFTDANPIIKESFAKQLLRSRRQAGYPDEPLRVRPSQRTHAPHAGPGPEGPGDQHGELAEPSLPPTL
ncbi:uncharacterized protein C17orf67 homolog isoform 2-T2 [Pholidichthys leucotaenia]